MDTLVATHYRKCSGRRTVDGVKFISYSTGINRYAQISEDGQIKIWDNHRHTANFAEVIGHGVIKNVKGKPLQFRSWEGAARSALMTLKKIREK